MVARSTGPRSGGPTSPERSSPAARRATRGDFTDDDVARLYRDDGLTGAEIGAELGCSPSIVYHRLARLGIPRRPAGLRHTGRPANDTLRSLYSTRGCSLRGIATDFGVTPQAVRGWLLDAGVRSGAPAPPPPTGTPRTATSLCEVSVVMYAPAARRIADSGAGCTPEGVRLCAATRSGAPR